MTPREPEPLDEGDDDALHWAGDEARGQSAPRLRGGTEPDADASPADDSPEPTPPRTPRDTAFLVGTGAFALVYLAISIGWIWAVQLLVYPAFDLLGGIMWQFGEFLAMVSAALWFAAAITLTPASTARRGTKRMLGLLAGAIVLIPWPALLYWIGSAS